MPAVKNLRQIISVFITFTQLNISLCVFRGHYAMYLCEISHCKRPNEDLGDDEKNVIIFYCHFMKL